MFWKLGNLFEEGLVYTQVIQDALLPRLLQELRVSIHVLNEAQKKIIAHLFNAGVIDSFHRNYTENTNGKGSLHRKEVVWTLTDLGKKLYYASAAIRTDSQSDFAEFDLF